MRRFEFIEDSSRKFWSIHREGSAVQAHWGRIGTAGQEKSKTYASEALAQADLDQQVTSKLKKGYQEVLGDAPASPASAVPEPKAPVDKPEPAGPEAASPEPQATAQAEDLPDEDRFEWPDRWASKIIPWPGRDRGQPPATSLKAAMQKLGQLGATEADLAGPVEQVLARYCELYENEEKLAVPLVDALVLSRGLVFAVDVLARVQPQGTGLYFLQARRTKALERLRRHLAAGSPEDVREAQAHAAEIRRSAEPPVKSATSFLFPLNQDWVAEDIREINGENSFLVQCVADADKAAAAMHHRYSLVELDYCITYELRGDALPILLQAIKATYAGSDEMPVIHSLLALLPKDEALEALFSRFEDRQYSALCLEAAERFPCRALRVATQRKGLEGIIRQAAVRWPAAVEAVRPSLSESQLAVLAAALRVARRAPEASPEAWPEVLANPPWLAGIKRPAPKTVDLVPLEEAQKLGIVAESLKDLPGRLLRQR